ncbi:MAG: DUF1634 domain-containing protein [Candidatus Methanomethylophilaceae archaeon]|nr:DUF1634 domain-containing protein [Candidatus Methanomethylophilaceae archaeon]MDD3379273.1 DUF1634 domain-containing protein [Candidatus Methanomethylophilaceae archaeon]MDY0224289.1 DUF1634 domain-containing protein [Candidatus Methanomethylophilaceae archaeon]
MNMTDLTALTLKTGVVAGIIVMMIGLIFSSQDTEQHVLWLGILILICTPLAGVIVTYASLIKDEDWKWVRITTILIIVMTVGLVVSFLYK